MHRHRTDQMRAIMHSFILTQITFSFALDINILQYITIAKLSLHLTYCNFSRWNSSRNGRRDFIVRFPVDMSWNKNFKYQLETIAYTNSIRYGIFWNYLFLIFAGLINLLSSWGSKPVFFVYTEENCFRYLQRELDYRWRTSSQHDSCALDPLFQQNTHCKYFRKCRFCDTAGRIGLVLC